jgi:uncharacterized protein (TIGR02001 family)
VQRTVRICLAARLSAHRATGETRRAASRREHRPLILERDPMRFSNTLLGGLALAVAPVAASAQDVQDAPATPMAPAEATAPPAALTVTGGATLVSDYRFRGYSQSNRKPAIQATATVTHESGLYASFWGSSIDDYVANGADQELDLIAGYSHTLGNGVKLDGGILYYYYPGGGHANTDYFEPYADISATYGPVTGKVTVNYAWNQAGLSIGNGKEDNVYLAGDLSGGIPNTPVSLTAHLGHTFGQSYISVGDGYTDWNLGAAVTFSHITVGVSYVDTDKNVYYGARNRNLTGSGVVASLGASF